MGKYFNPGNDGFRGMIQGEYVDKTGMIDIMNRFLGKASERLVCLSRPRRFGKSYAAKMLCAYYDIASKSDELFRPFEIYGMDTYAQHLNQYNILYLDISGFYGNGSEDVVNSLRSEVIEDAKREYDLKGPISSVADAVLMATEKTGRSFIAIIDEWDVIFREEKRNERIQMDYMSLLRSLFKNNNVTDKVFQGAYMTGILPIKKYGHQSAVSDFVEYSMTDPGPFASYIGFTEAEVKTLCAEKERDFFKMKEWYDGYDYPPVGSIYNPNSVMKSLQSGVFKGYWTKSETFETLRDYIEMDFDGLQENIIAMMGDDTVKIDTETFQNDMTSIANKDDVLTLLVHLGYLAYNVESEKVHIPNEEIQREFARTLRNGKRKELMELIQSSDRMLDATLRGDGDAVANAVGKIHETGVAPLLYNDEQCLRYVIRFGYLSAMEDYVCIEELPSGHGYVDIAYLPKRGVDKPAMVVELKWNKPIQSAMNQIKDRDYPAALKGFGRGILLVGITYDEKSKIHTCSIERV